MDHWPGFDQILGRAGRQRGKAHEVKRAIGDDEHARRVRQVGQEWIPDLLTQFSRDAPVGGFTTPGALPGAMAS